MQHKILAIINFNFEHGYRLFDFHLNGSSLLEFWSFYPNTLHFLSNNISMDVSHGMLRLKHTNHTMKNELINITHPEHSPRFTIKH